MFQSQVRFPVVVALDFDPGADEVIPIWVAPQKAYIHSAKVVVTNDVAASTADWFQLTLRNGGTAGTATQNISDTIGGTAGWSGLKPVAFTINDPVVEAGEVVELVYDENGVATFGSMIVQLDVTYGEA